MEAFEQKGGMSRLGATLTVRRPLRITSAIGRLHRRTTACTGTQVWVGKHGPDLPSPRARWGRRLHAILSDPPSTWKRERRARRVQSKARPFDRCLLTGLSGIYN
jgi:hypothetical protein